MIDICEICNKKSKATGKLDHSELERLGDSCNQVVFQKNDRIMVQDAMSYNIVFVKDGLVKVHAKGPEKEQILRIVKAPSYLGIPTTIGAKTNQYSATAICETSVCYISFDVFKEFINKNGQFAYEILLELCTDELYFYKRFINHQQKQSSGKLAEALLYFSNEIFDTEKFIIPLSRNELADLTCSSRETVSRVLSDFTSNGIIELSKNKITILDKEQLELISRKG